MDEHPLHIQSNGHNIIGASVLIDNIFVNNLEERSKSKSSKLVVKKNVNEQIMSYV